MWILSFGTVFVFSVIIWFMPKRISRKEMYITWLAIAAITLFIDLIFGVSLDAYDFGEDAKPRIPETIIQVTLTPLASIIFLNYMPQKRGRFGLYVGGWTIFAILFEWACVKTGYLSHKNWRFFFSIPFYIATSIYLKWHLNYIRK